MCGIVGFVSDRKNEELISSLSNSLKHRGPDKVSYRIVEFNNKYLHLGSARLSITGLIDGDMPMVDEYQNALIYNGEIYELKKLREQFSLNIESKSDTRHLFKFLKNYQTKYLPDLNGMFAFCYFDKLSEKIYLARDRFGFKPLFYGHSDDFDLFFSSEIKPLTKNGMLGNSISENTFNNFILLGALDQGSNIIDNLKTVPPGNVVEYKDKTVEIKEYNKHIVDDRNDSGQSFSEIFKTTLEDQLTAEVPVNVLLSGGIDSTLISTFASKYSNKSVTAYSLGFENEKYNEQSKAENISEQLNIQLKKFVYPSKDNENIIEEILEILPEPVADPSIIPTYYLNKKVAEHTKVVLSGDGADELFGGYQWYRAGKLTELIPNYALLGLKKILSIFLNSKNSYISLNEKLKIVTSSRNSSTLVKLLFWQNYLPHLSFEERKIFYERFLIKQGFDNLNNTELMSQVDIKNYLYTNILKKSDLASMLNSLEVRPVFLDNRIYNFSKTLKLNDNVNLFNEKKFLKNQLLLEFQNYEIKKKQGFSHDFGGWSDDIAIPYLKKNWNDLKHINSLLKYLENSNDNNYLKSRYIWRYYSFLKWIENNRISIN